MIKLNNVSKNFGGIQALDNVSLNINSGEVFGLLGPNGAGKSTTINIISTILKPDSGEIFINEKPLSSCEKERKMEIGIVPQEISLYEDLSAFENLMFWGELYNIDSKNLKNIINEKLDFVGLSDRKNDLIKTFSGGMKRRINIAASILHKPKVLLMDEPTVGIDPQSRNRIFEVVQQLNAEGVTVIYTTHYMEEAEKLCSRIAIIDLGKIVAEGNLAQLKQIGKASDSLTITTASTLSDKTALSFPETDSVKIFGNKIKIECSNFGKQLSAIVNELDKQQIDISGIESESASLETIFLNLTGKQLRD
ncbi:MAG: ABC transporter ATP-binding protein [Rhodothermaceae bacterium]